MPKNNDLLIRIDERISHIKKEMVKHDAHFSKIYDKLEQQGKHIEKLKVKVAMIYITRMKFW